MTLTTAQLDDLREKARILIGLNEEDSSYRAPAFTVYDDGASNASMTVSVLYDQGNTTREIEFVGDVTGTTTLDLAATAYDTIGELVSFLQDSGPTGLVLELIYPDGNAPSDLLEQLPATNCFGSANEVTLYIENRNKLDQLIQQSFSSVETYLSRALYSATYSERIHLDRDGRDFVLEQPDVTSVDFVGTCVLDAFRARYSGSDTRATLEVTDTSVVLRSRAGATTTTTTLTFALNGAVSDLVTAIGAVAGWTATALNEMPSEYLIRHGARNADGMDVCPQGFDDYDGEYEVEYDPGLLRFDLTPWNMRGQMLISYTAGFATLPEDIEGVILAVVKDAWNESERDSSVAEERLGDYMYKTGDETGGSSASSISDHENVLSKYRRNRP